MAKWRIVRHDEYNWTVERFQAGGKPITRGRHAGNLTKEGWRIKAYLGRLEQAAEYLLDRKLGDSFSPWNGQNLADAISAAKAAVIEACKDFHTPSPVISSVKNPAADLTPEQKRDILEAKSPAATYVKITGAKRFKRSQDETRRKLTPDEAAKERCQ